MISTKKLAYKIVQKISDIGSTVSGLSSTVSGLSSTVSGLSSTVSSHTTSLNKLKVSISSNTLTFGDLKFTYVTGNCANAQQVNLSLNYSQTPWVAIPYIAQPGFGACGTATVVSTSKNGIVLYQYNNANVATTVGALVIGKA